VDVMDRRVYRVAETSSQTWRRAGSGRPGDAHGTGDSRSPQAAVAIEILREVLLVGVLGVIELGGGQDLGRDGAVARGRELPLERALRGLGRRALRLVEGVDARAVLHARVVPLPHTLRRIMVFPEQLQQLLVRDLRGIEDDEDDLAVPRLSRADLAVRGVRSHAGGIADGGREDAAPLPENFLGAPETSHPEESAPHPRGEGRLERAAVDEVLLWDGHGGGFCSSCAWKKSGSSGETERSSRPIDSPKAAA